MPFLRRFTRSAQSVPLSICERIAGTCSTGSTITCAVGRIYNVGLAILVALLLQRKYLKHEPTCSMMRPPFEYPSRFGWQFSASSSSMRCMSFRTGSWSINRSLRNLLTWNTASLRKSSKLYLERQCGSTRKLLSASHTYNGEGAM